MATTTTEFYIRSTDGWVEIAAAADMNIVKGPNRRPWALYAGASAPSLNATPASATLSYTGRPTAGTKAAGTLTFEDDGDTGDSCVADETFTVGDVVYTLSEDPSAEGDVLLGADNLETAANLAAAINGDDLNDPHPLFEASVASLVLTITALLNGTASNAAATTTDSDGAAWGAADVVDGAAGQTFSVAGNTYTFVTTLSKPAHVEGGLSGEVVIGADADGDYANLTAALNGSGTEGTTYANDTPSLPEGLLATHAPSTDDLTISGGPFDNGVPISETLSNATLDDSATALSGGAPAPKGMRFGTGGAEADHELALPGIDGKLFARVLGDKVSLPSDAPLHFTVISITSS